MKAFAPTFLITVALMTTSAVSAAVYKYIDENGNVAYGDKPVDGSQKLNIQSTRKPSPEPADEDDSTEQSTDSSPNELDEGTAEEAAKAIAYKSLSLLTPKPGKQISGRSASVQIIFLPTPALARSDELVITVDGKDISKGRDANLSLQDLTRGSHTVQGRILDANGKMKIQSDAVTFHVKGS